MKRRDVGVLGEKIAANYLKKQGYRVHETNFRCREGEIDIIAEKDDCLVFVEVRSRTSNSFGSPAESITPAKVERLIVLGQIYIESHTNLPSSSRIDVVTVELTAGNKVSRIETIENATG